LFPIKSLGKIYFDVAAALFRQETPTVPLLFVKKSCDALGT